MKKILMNAAVVTMMLASCTNEELVNQGTDGRMFTLEVTKGANSRTALDGLQTVWSEGDKIYVTSEDGKTTGVLTLASKPGLPDGTFQGYIFGEGELKYSVYPVPTQEGLNLGAADLNKLDAPMTGEINAGTASFVNSCGLVKLNVLGLGDKDVVKVSGAEIGSVMEYDLATNSWVKKSAGSTISITGAQDATEFFVPVYTTNTTATDVELSVSVNGGIAQKVTVPVAVKKVNPKTPILAVTSTGDVVDPSTANNSLLGDDYIYVKTTDDLYEILGNNNKAGTAEDGAYVVLQKGVHVLDHSKEGNGQLSVTKDLTIVGEDGAQIKGGYYTNTSSSRPFYIYCSSVENLVIKNIDFIKGDGQDQRLAELWFSGSEADYMKGNPDSQKIKVLLDNVGVEQVRLENYFGYQKGLVMDVTINGCNIGTVMIENWGNGNKTYFTYDSGSEINLRYNLVNDGEESVFVNMIK